VLSIVHPSLLEFLSFADNGSAQSRNARNYVAAFFLQDNRALIAGLVTPAFDDGVMSFFATYSVARSASVLRAWSFVMAPIEFIGMKLEATTRRAMNGTAFFSR
jgi:hypothetical protein